LVFSLGWIDSEAQNGAFEINQTCAETGCFPGDDPGFPIWITTKGTYILTSNITVESLDDIAIRSTTANVVLDLRGFEISGPNECDGEPLVCGSGSGNGVIFLDQSQISNGAIRGFGQWGLSVGDGSIISNIVTENNGSYGFVINSFSTVRDSIAFRNSSGFSAASSSIFDSVSAINNRQFGIALNGSPTDGGNFVRNCFVRQNSDGIYDWGNSKIQNCSIQRNGLAIDSFNGGTEISDSLILFNTTPLRNRGGENISSPPSPVVLRNLTINNNAESIQNSSPGTLVFAEDNVCDDDAC
jgi:hypothetical protein